MAGDDLEAVRRYLEALNARDLDGVMAVCAEDFELRPPIAPLEGAYVGRKGVQRYLADIGEASEDFRLEVREMDDRGAGVVVAELLGTGSSRSLGALGELPVTTVYELVAGRVCRASAFLDRPDALAAAAALGREAELIREGYEARTRGGAEGVAAVRRLMAPDLEVHLQSAGFDAAAGPVRGPDAFVARLREFEEAFPEVESEIERMVRLGGGRHLVLGSQVARSASGVEVRSTLSHLWTVRDGRVARIEIHNSPEDALRAAGLEGREPG